LTTEANPADQIALLKQQVDALAQQLALANAQLALNTAKQVGDEQLVTAVTEALKKQTAASSDLEAEQAKAAFASLSGIKAGISGMQLPTGKSGTVQVAAGTAGTALLRSKGPMLNLLVMVATELARQLPDGAVIVTDSQVEQAFQARFTMERLRDQTERLNMATIRATPKEAWTPPALPKAIPSFQEPEAGAVQTKGIAAPAVATAYTAGLVLDTINNLGKLFRTDRKVDIFSADDEAAQLLGYLLEAENANFLTVPTLLNSEVSEVAKSLLTQLTNLLRSIQAATDRLKQIQKIEDEEGKDAPSRVQLPEPQLITELKGELSAASALFDSLDPSKNLDTFWAKSKGQLLSKVLRDRNRLIVEAKGQAIQITKSRWYWSDLLMTSGAVQVAYRVYKSDGSLQRAGVILKASTSEVTSLDKIADVSFPPND
jgi:hypothetical protein